MARRAAERRTKHTVTTDAETWRRLGRLALDLDTDRSKLLEVWARKELERYERAGYDLSPPSAAQLLDAAGEGKGEAA